MTLTVTPGASNADSYLILSDYRTRCAALGLTYTAVDDPTDEATGRRSALWLDANYRHRWPGTKLNGRLQSREWPRANATDMEGLVVSSASIPEEIIAAQVFAWYYEALVPFSLTPKIDVNKSKILTKAEGIEWKPLLMATAPADLKPTLFLVENALSSLISFNKSPYFGVV